MSMTTIQNLTKQKAELIEAMRSQGRDALKEVFKEFFEKYPEVEAVRWSQYTPYFNDGETCTFGLGEFTYRLKDRAEDHEGDYGDGFDEAYVYGERKKLPFYDTIKEIGRIDDEIFEIAFGDHKQVTATSDGFEIEEYDHE